MYVPVSACNDDCRSDNLSKSPAFFSECRICMYIMYTYMYIDNHMCVHVHITSMCVLKQDNTIASRYMYMQNYLSNNTLRSSHNLYQELMNSRTEGHARRILQLQEVSPRYTLNLLNSIFSCCRSLHHHFLLVHCNSNLTCFCISILSSARASAIALQHIAWR